MRALDELMVPQLCREDSDDRLILSEAGYESGAAAPQKPVHRRRGENPHASQRIGAEVIRNPLWRSRPKEARCIGSPVRLLSSTFDARRQNARCPATQNFLLAKSAQSRSSRKRRRELEKPMIEERETSLDTMRHRHSIALGAQQIRREKCGHLQVRRTIQG